MASLSASTELIQNVFLQTRGGIRGRRATRRMLPTYLFITWDNISILKHPQNHTTIESDRMSNVEWSVQSIPKPQTIGRVDAWKELEATIVCSSVFVYHFVEFYCVGTRSSR